MTARVGRITTFRRATLLVAAGLTLGGCSSAAVDPPMAVNGPINTGTYPNLNVRPNAAASQFTDAERRATMAELETAQQRQGAGTGTETAEARRRRLQLLAEGHGADTLKAIENR